MTDLPASPRDQPERAPRKRRWLTFSLRSLFIALTIFAVWLGWWTESARRQAKIAAAIRAADGYVEYDPAEWRRDQWIPQSWRDRLGADFFHNVSSTHFYDSAESGDRLTAYHDAVARANWQSKAWYTLYFRNTEDTIRRLRDYGDVRHLNLNGWLSAPVVESMAQMPLESLAISISTAQAETVMPKLGALKGLKYLGVYVVMSDDGQTPTLTWARYLNQFPLLEHLVLQGYVIPTTDEIREIHALHHLKRLHIEQDFSREKMEAIADQFPNLEELAAWHISDAGVMEPLKKLTGLRDIEIGEWESQHAGPIEALLPGVSVSLHYE